MWFVCGNFDVSRNIASTWLVQGTTDGYCACESSLIKDQCSNFHDLFLNHQKNELDSDHYDKICGYHFYIHLAHNTVKH